MESAVGVAADLARWLVAAADNVCKGSVDASDVVMGPSW